MSKLRWLRWVVPGVALAWLAVSVGQQDAPPAPPPAAEPREAPEPASPERPADDDQESDDVFVPTEELAPDAAVTFPVDI